MSEEYEEGWAAFFYNLRLEDNPYEWDTIEACDWENGFRDAEWGDAQ